MGNRAVIKFENYKAGIYLHQHGGRGTIECFLEVAKEYGIDGNSGDYTMARLVQIISNYIGGTLSIGISVEPALHVDQGDNGVYVVDDNLEIVDRYWNWEHEQLLHRSEAERLKADIRAVNDQFFTGANLYGG